MMGPTIEIARDAAEAASVTARHFVALARERGLVPREGAAAAGELHIAVSGGSVATSVVPALVDAGQEAGLDWSRLHVWFADERFVARGHDDRNAVPIVRALRDASGFDEQNLHVTLTSDAGVSLEEAAEAYEQELRETVPALDLVLLGAGDDGHTASLFPGHALVHSPDPARLVAVIRDSPKPPPERLTLTLAAIGDARHVWAVVTGAGKAPAVGRALSEPTPTVSPLGASLHTANGEGRLLIVDELAASQVPGSAR